MASDFSDFFAAAGAAGVSQTALDANWNKISQNLSSNSVTTTTSTLQEIPGGNSSSSAVTKTTASDDGSQGTAVSGSGVSGSSGVISGPAPTGDFMTVLKAALGKSGQQEINEEELFAALIEQRLQVNNKDAAEVYWAEKNKLVSGGMSCEDAGKAGLKAAVASGKLTLDEAEKVHAYAFKAAQLDSNTDELWDGSGGADDPTRAVAAMESALMRIQTMSDDYEKGALTLTPRSLDIASNTVASSRAKLGLGAAAGGSESSGSAVGTVSGDGTSTTGTAKDGSEGFLWKPVSDSNGKLAVILPKDLAGMIERVEIHSALPPTPDNLLATGRFSANANGGRDHFRFSKPGGDYPDNCYVVAYKNGGGTVTYAINDTSSRID